MSHSQFHSTKLFILRHAWLNLWDKHMTTGRINQVTFIFAYLWPGNASKSAPPLGRRDTPLSTPHKSLIHTTRCAPRLHFLGYLFKNAKVLLWLQGQRQLWVPKDLHTHTPASELSLPVFCLPKPECIEENRRAKKNLNNSVPTFSNAPSCWCELQAKVPRLLA